jgi:O-phospho-L-seryl-tRNASec:L-selenocysteinyl-tRNA synthase
MHSSFTHSLAYTHMEPSLIDAFEALVSPRYVSQGASSTRSQDKAFERLVANRRMPKNGWTDVSIEFLLRRLAVMDSNNFVDNVGVGEREARTFSSLVRQRSYGMAHGIGRSGDVTAEQPKACGSSAANKLCAALARDALRIAGMNDLGKAFLVLPLATGMTMTLVLSSLRMMRRGAAATGATKVIWCRLDQKTCVKAATCAGLDVVVIEPKLQGDQLVTDVDAVERAIDEIGGDNLVGVVTSTSCFAPRACDEVEAVAKICEKKDVPHVINNAYGVQSRELCARVSKAWTVGRVDAVVQSTDKNFMVPVGGALVCCGKRREDLVRAVGQNYPGRASASAMLDLFITLLAMGEEHWSRLLAEREDLYAYMRSELVKVAEEVGERVLDTPGNPISMAMTLSCAKSLDVSPTLFGSMLFSRCVSGTRVVAPGETKNVGGVELRGFGASHSAYPETYFTAAAAIGTTRADVDRFVVVLRKTFKDFKKKGSAVNDASA